MGSRCPTSWTWPSSGAVWQAAPPRRRGAQLGARVVLLEAESIGWGASSRSGGMCHPGFKWSPTELMERHGAILGESIYRESVDAFEWTAETIRKRGSRPISCAPGTYSSPTPRRSWSTSPRRPPRSRRWARSPARYGLPSCGPRSARTPTRGRSWWSVPGGWTQPGMSRGWPPRPSGPAPRSMRVCGRSGSGRRRTDGRSWRRARAPWWHARSSSPRTATRTASRRRSGAGCCRSAAPSSPRTRFPRTSPTRSARTAGCSSTRRTSSTTGV